MCSIGKLRNRVLFSIFVGPVSDHPYTVSLLFPERARYDVHEKPTAPTNPRPFAFDEDDSLRWLSWDFIRQSVVAKRGIFSEVPLLQLCELFENRHDCSIIWFCWCKRSLYNCSSSYFKLDGLVNRLSGGLPSMVVDRQTLCLF